MSPPGAAVVGRWPAGLAGGAAAGWLMRVLHLPLPWLIGPLLAMAALRLAGAPAEPVPGGRQARQVVIGVAVGLYFTAASSPAMPRAMLLTCCATLMLGALTALILTRLGGVDLKTAYFCAMPAGAALCATMGAVLARLLHIQAAAAILATAPGSIGEMAVTARVLGVAVPIVTAFQLVRILIVVPLAGPFFVLCGRVAGRLSPRPGLGD